VGGRLERAFEVQFSFWRRPLMRHDHVQQRQAFHGVSGIVGTENIKILKLAEI
jgi:hypothetical protein